MPLRTKSLKPKRRIDQRRREPHRIDLAHSPFVSSAGFRAIHQIFKDLNTAHPDLGLSEEDMKQGISAGSYKSLYLKLVNLSSDTKAVFKTTGFDMYLECHDDLATAIASF